MLRKVLLVCLAWSFLGDFLKAEELISWHVQLDEARKISQQYKVPVLLHFYGDQCVPCKTLEKNVFTRPEVATTVQRYFVPVRINATQDRRTAAEYGVHSWPTDVFISPDGKVLTQGVCNQNATSYLQNLQSVAVMNRDRNVMLAADAPTTFPPAGNKTPYGRTASASLQQSAPGRDQAPSPYSNPSSGAAPYASRGEPSGLIGAGQSNMPSPTWSGQSAHGQALGGLIGSGPLPSGSVATLHPSETGMSQSHKDANLPQTLQQSVQWQNPPNASSGLTATVPNNFATNHSDANGFSTRPADSGMMHAALNPAQGAVVENPHFAAQAKPTESTARQVQPSPSATQASSPNHIQTHLVSVGRQNSTQPPISAVEPQASLPALSGFCPVALFASGQWVEGLPQHAIRHRGRIYFLSSPEAVTKFLAAPDSFSPVLSGYDPLIFLSQGRLVEGTVYDGLKDPKQNQILLFATAANKKFFQDNYDRLAAELTTILTPPAPLTAAAPVNTLTR